MVEQTVLVSSLTRITPLNLSGRVSRFTLSIVLEEQATRGYQKVRVLLVYKPLDCGQSRCGGHGYNLRRIMLTSNEIRSRPPITQPIDDESPLKIIVVEIYPEGPRRQLSLRLVRTVSKDWDSAFKVADSWTQGFSGDLPAYAITFEASFPFCVAAPANPFFSQGPSLDNRRGVFYNLRIFSLGRARLDTRIIFPEPIARAIGWHLIWGLNVGWRRDLLHFGLACKATSNALTAFFEIQQQQFLTSCWLKSYNDDSKPSIGSVLSSLQWKPERANLIQCISPTFYKRFRPSKDRDGYTRYWEALIRLLSLAKGTKHFIMQDLPPQLYPQLIHSLEGHHRTEILDGITKSNQSGSQSLSFTPQDIFTFLAQWPHLHTTNVQINRAATLTPNPETRDALQTACNLKDLKITSSQLEKSHLLRFLPSTETPRLSVLHLVSVVGIGNQELKIFLGAVAPGITVIRISHCRFHPSFEDESTVLDETFAKMAVLKTLAIIGSGNLLGPSCICARRDTVPGSRLTVINTRPFRLKDIINALRSTKWDSVIVKCDSLDHDGEALRVARERGAQFTSYLDG